MDKFNDYFMKDDFSNREQFVEMSRFLMDALASRIDSRRPTIPSNCSDYAAFLDNDRIPEMGRDWRPVFEEFLEMFQHAVIWQSPGAMINITPPANIPALIASFCTALFNPNFGTDESSGFLMATELSVIRKLASLVKWNVDLAGGIFTFGGKGTILYALKTGLRKACPEIDHEGITPGKCVIFTNDKAHPCHTEIASWLGLGTNQVIRLKTTEKGTVDVQDFETQLRAQLFSGKKIGCIFLNGGTTNEGFIDPIEKIVSIRNRCAEEYGLTYLPHIHVDAVIGWVWLFFSKYDFKQNPLNCSSRELQILRDNARYISQIEQADSFGADFHKTGFCPYISSVFLVRDRDCLFRKRSFNPKTQKYGEFAPFEDSLELTRSSLGPVSAYITLELFGIDGFQKMIYRLFHSGEVIRHTISQTSGFELIHTDAKGFSVMFLAIPPDFSPKKEWTEEDFRRLAQYNQKFYLYVEQAYWDRRIHSKITFSKSFKPYGSNQSIGALKMFPMSPIVFDDQLLAYTRELLALKPEFDRHSSSITDTLDRPEDLVWRL